MGGVPTSKTLFAKRNFIGKERTYQASASYIQRHVIPEDWLPVIPQAAVQDTKRMEINRLKRKVARAEEAAKKSEDKYKKLKTHATPQKYIARAS
ncbi:DNA_MISMATCH_REPAIR_2 domain-containing protein [Psidium guajava]|nr:DNA_MISMATCH_REPAIR_2 domain-containing protein [Psidium guajava]